MNVQKGSIWIGLTIILNFCIIWETYSQKVVSPLRPIDEQQVQHIAQLLVDTPAGYGDPCRNRKVWDLLLKSGKYTNFLKSMKHFTFPAFSKEDYYSLSDGSATSSARGLNMMRNRAEGLAQATWAECLQNDGTYTPVIEAGLRDILHQASWVSPRNDFGFKNFKGEEYSVELTSALYAHTIAQTLYMMGDKLDAGLRKEAIDALWKRVFDPVLRKISTQNKESENGFLLATNNYNHVCLSGVVGAALTILEDKHERAVFAYIGEYYSRNGINGFGDDGYCSEGIGYFNYGFGHYVLLRESIRQATNGKLDLFAIPKVKKIAAYGVNLEIINGVFPTISDSRQGTRPDSAIMNYLSRNLALGLTKYDTLTFEGNTENNSLDVLMVFPNSASQSRAVQVEVNQDQKLRSYFEQSAVLILRPLDVTPRALGVAFKGGNNAEHHNHNDVGSYTIVLGKEIMQGDPGAIPYTADIFSAQHRYTYKTIGSYGHPVPLVAGQQQQTGITARADILQANFSDSTDVFAVDISSTYDVPGLKKLTRKLTYHRGEKSLIEVKDQYAYDTPMNFETALITRAHWKELEGGKILLEGKSGKILVSISSPGNIFTLHTEKISEGGLPYVRIGISLSEPSLSGEINVNYESIK